MHLDKQSNLCQAGLERLSLVIRRQSMTIGVLLLLYRSIRLPQSLAGIAQILPGEISCGKNVCP